MSFQRIALATRKGLLILEPANEPNDRSGWKVVHEAFPGCHVSIVFLDSRSGNLFACIADGHFGNKLHRWSGFSSHGNIRGTDPKTVWQEIPAPKFPEGAKLATGKDAVLNYQWGMAAGSPNQPGRIYIGSEPGGLFKSDDHGDSFELVRGLWDHPTRLDKDMPWMGGGMDNPGIHSICVDPRNEDCVRVGISCAGVFQSDDDCQTWRHTNKGLKAYFLPDPDVDIGHDPHILVQSSNDPDCLWQQNHCGIFRSINGGQTWSDVSEKDGPANFGFVIATDPNDGETAWVVPAESDMVRAAVDRSLCVCRTTDGGKSWQAFREGLPQGDCYDFVFRHCLIQSKDELVFGTACGSLYLSTDRGESWKTLANHFPPIYSVASV